MYRPCLDSVTQSRVFPPEPVDPSETAVALTKIGEGWLGYVGDVNNEQGSQDVILAMLLLAAKHATYDYPVELDSSQGMLWRYGNKDVEE